ncbi:MAG: hypothetical protein LLG08_08110 [Actinomycetia bacterium]|nr:hypothetical protein [Actinomycetes bacterium]
MGPIIAIAGGVLAVIGIAVAVVGPLGTPVSRLAKTTGHAPVPTATVETSPAAGFATAEDALKAKLPEYGRDWIYTVSEESGARVRFWIGPPASEFVAEVTVSKGADGSWGVTAERRLDVSNDSSPGSSQTEMSSAEEAAAIVTGYLKAVMQDRQDDARAFTVEPFAGADASNGGFKNFAIDGSTEQSDGSFWVKTTQTWTRGTEKRQYWLVPTEAGYRIAAAKAW